MVKNCWNINGYELKIHNPHYVKYAKAKVYYIQIPLHKSTLFAFHVVLCQICAWYSLFY